MSLRPLIEIASENERVHALAGDVRAAVDGGQARTVRASAMLRPLLLAARLEDDRGLAGRPALLVSADDRSARALPADLRAYLAPPRVRLYPSRGTGHAPPAPSPSPRPSPTPPCARPASPSPRARRSSWGRSPTISSAPATNGSSRSR